MPNWLIKSAVHRAISCLPSSHRWNEVGQRYVTKGLQLTPSSLDASLERCREHMAHYLTVSGGPKEDFTVLELGTGWWAVDPVGLYLCGASEIWTYDVVPLLSKRRFREMLERLCVLGESGELIRILPWMRQSRLERLCELLPRAHRDSPVELLESLNIHALIHDAQHTGLPSER